MKTIISLLMVIAAASPAALAAGNPFEAGTKTVKLSEAERDNLLQYVNQSRATLEAAIDEAKGKSLDLMRTIYSKAARRVVLDSFSSKPRSELLLRFMLNQALELTDGIPTADGKHIAKPGVLANSANRDVMVLILEDSIRLALEYVAVDLEAIQKSTLLDLPYVTAATRKLHLAKHWVSSVLEVELTEALLQKTLQHWLNTVAAADQLHQAAHAVEIRDIDEVLKETEIAIMERDERIRLLRRKFKWLLGRFPIGAYGDKIQNPLPEENAPATPQPKTSSDNSSEQFAEIPDTSVFSEGTISFGFTQTSAEGVSSRRLEVLAKATFYDPCRASGSAEASCRNNWYMDKARFVPFEITVRYNLPGSAEDQKFEIQRFQAKPLEMVFKSVGIALGVAEYKFQRLNYNLGHYHRLHIGTVGIDFARPILTSDGTFELVIRGKAGVGMSLYSKANEHQYGNDSTLVSVEANTEVGINIAKTVLISLYGGIDYMNGGHVSENPYSSNSDNGGVYSNAQYGASLMVSPTKWLHFKLNLGREIIRYRHEYFSRGQDYYNANDNVKSSFAKSISGLIASGAIEVTW